MELRSVTLHVTVQPQKWPLVAEKIQNFQGRGAAAKRILDLAERLLEMEAEGLISAFGRVSPEPVQAVHSVPAAALPPPLPRPSEVGPPAEDLDGMLAQFA